MPAAARVTAISICQIGETRVLVFFFVQKSNSLSVKLLFFLVYMYVD